MGLNARLWGPRVGNWNPIVVIKAALEIYVM